MVVFDRIAVLPFQQIVPEDLHSGAVRCPLRDDLQRRKGRPEPGNGGRGPLSGTTGKKQTEIQHHCRGACRRGLPTGFRGVPQNPLRQILRDVGSELGAEGIVTGYVYRFRERKGEPFAVEQPASVAFEIHLHRVEDGVLVWRGAFDRTQSSLMEDLLQILFFYREKGRWVTAEELAEEGLEKVLKTFPGLRNRLLKRPSGRFPLRAGSVMVAFDPGPCTTFLNSLQKRLFHRL